MVVVNFLYGTSYVFGLFLGPVIAGNIAERFASVTFLAFIVYRY